jgi:putative oxidoreductase
MDKLTSWAPRALSVLRIITGLLFLEHGMQKLLGFPAGEMAHSPLDFSLMGLSGVFELVGGALILLGLFTRPVALILCGMMAIAYWTVHFPGNPYPVNNQGDAAILYCFVFFYFIFAGAGPISIDAMMKKR